MDRPRGHDMPATAGNLFPVGSKLKNGATVIAFGVTIDPVVAGIVLAMIPGSPQPYATWMINHDGATYTGNYFRNVTPAAVDFDARVERLNQGRAYREPRG